MYTKEAVNKTYYNEEEEKAFSLAWRHVYCKQPRTREELIKKLIMPPDSKVWQIPESMVMYGYQYIVAGWWGR